MSIIGADLPTGMQAAKALGDLRSCIETGPENCGALTQVSRMISRHRCVRRACIAHTRARQILSFANQADAFSVWPWLLYKAAGTLPCWTSSAHGTGPRRNTVPQAQPHSQTAGVAWMVAVPYASSSSVLDSFRNSGRDLHCLLARLGLYPWSDAGRIGSQPQGAC